MPRSWRSSAPAPATASAALRGATLVVTLEPCCHQGRTGPCTDAIIAAGIRRVWVGQRDPNPRVAGGGLRRLRRAGLSLRIGVLESECREQHRGFLSVQQRGRPWVSLKLAATPGWAHRDRARRVALDHRAGRARRRCTVCATPPMR